jgi:hypothetical protein
MARGICCEFKSKWERSMNMRKPLCGIVMAAGLLFASATNSSAVVSGDVDGDGVVRVADALLVLRYVAGKESLTPIQILDCDVTDVVFPNPGSDGKCDIVDALTILQKAYGLITF